jgi:hypothetical protein
MNTTLLLRIIENFIFHMVCLYFDVIIIICYLCRKVRYHGSVDCQLLMHRCWLNFDFGFGWLHRFGNIVRLLSDYYWLHSTLPDGSLPSTFH